MKRWNLRDRALAFWKTTRRCNLNNAAKWSKSLLCKSLYSINRITIIINLTDLNVAEIWTPKLKIHLLFECAVIEHACTSVLHEHICLFDWELRSKRRNDVGTGQRGMLAITGARSLGLNANRSIWGITQNLKETTLNFAVQVTKGNNQPRRFFLRAFSFVCYSTVQNEERTTSKTKKLITVSGKTERGARNFS
jgi:hypothetical protein